MKVDLEEGRYDRQKLISWWNQDRLKTARVLVVGAGALGNEVVKNLALLGIGSIDIVDLDVIERSNLARCVMFREADNTEPKATVLAARVATLNPDCRAVGHVARVQTFGIGWLREFDVVIGALDNREARLWVNQACRKLGQTWIDGAIEGVRGVVKVFPPTGACYECTLGEVDRAILAKRRACSLLSEDEMLAGKVPTTATTSSVIGGLQAQEAVRLLHGEPSPLANRGWTFIGETFDGYSVDYREDEYCQAHDTYDDVVTVGVDADTTMRDVIIRFDDEDVVAIDLERELVRSASCAGCGWTTVLNQAIDVVAAEVVRCPGCEQIGALDATAVLGPEDPLLDEAISAIGMPDYEVLTVRSDSGRRHVCLRRSS